MPINAIFTGAALLSLGPIFYLLAPAGGRHFTAFIPSLFGLLILICGLLAATPSRTKAAMHAAVGIALLGALGSLGMGATTWPKLLSGGVVLRPLAAIAMLVMFVICAIFVALSVSRFIKMRKAI